MRNSAVETLIGAAVILVAAGFLYFAYNSTGMGGVSGYDLVARFARVDGVSTGTDVRLSGIKVGTVSKMDLDPKNFTAVLHLTVANDVQVPEDSAVKITSSGLLGSSYLSIEPGGSETNLKPGGEIENTQGSIDLIGLLSKVMFGGTDASKKPGDAGTSAPATPANNAAAPLPAGP